LKYSIFHEAFKARQEADYSDSAEFGEEDARRMLRDAEQFGRRLTEYLQSVDFTG
jgi:uncharacterized protein (UPF0332 family)